MAETTFEVVMLRTFQMLLKSLSQRFKKKSYESQEGRIQRKPYLSAS